MILQADPGRSYKVNAPEIQKATARVLESGWYILGKENRAFEDQFAQYNNSAYCLGVANGTDAVEIVLRGLGIGNGDKVATVANTAVATVSAIERAGAEVRFVDIEPGKFTMSAQSLDELLQKENHIKAVVVVHLFGASADLEAILRVAEKYNIPMIEDCAQAHGAEYKGKKCGTFGIAGCFSFYPTKNLGAFGDGGAVVTNDKTLYDRMNALRQYGWGQRYISNFSGINSRLDEMQAAILSVKLPYLDKNNDRRREIANLYRAALSSIDGLELPAEPPYCKHVYHQFVIRVKEGRRADLMTFLKNKAIGTAIHYPVIIPEQEGYKNIPLPCDLPEIRKVNDEILSLPMYPELTEREVETIISAIREFFQ